jgi:hypothetical protein
MSASFQRTVSNVFKNVKESIKESIEKSVKEHADNIVQLLRRKSESGGAYRTNQGVGVEAYKNSQNSMSKWRTYKIKSGKNSIGYAFRNDAVSKGKNPYPYVRSIYGEYDGGAFRSKQLSEARWDGFKKFALKALSGKIKYDIYAGWEAKKRKR